MEMMEVVEAESVTGAGSGMVEIVMVRGTTEGRLRMSLRLVPVMVRSDQVARRSGRAS